MLGGYYADEALSWSAQDVCNWLPANAEAPGTQTPGMLKTPPGLRPHARPNDIGVSVRGTYNADGRFFAVIDQKLCQLSNAGVLIPLGTVPGFGRVRFAHNQILNGNQVVVVNGNAGYVYNTVTKLFARLTDEAYPGAIDALFLDGYILQIEPRRRYFFNNEDKRDATAYNSFDRTVPEMAPDLIVGHAIFNGEYVSFGERTTEFFQNTGATEQPFRSKGIGFDVGAAARYGIVSLDGSVYWFGHDGMFYRLNSYSPERISTRPIEEMVRGFNWADCFAFTWVDSGHSVIYWTFPNGKTIGFDISNGTWHRRASYGLERWRANSMTYWRDGWYAGDCLSGAIFKVDWDYMLEQDKPFESERSSQVLHDSMNRVFIPRLELLFSPVSGNQETVAVNFPEQPPSPILSGNAPSTVAGSEYSYTYETTSGTAPYTYSIVVGSLPPGLSINANTSEISGIPTTNGTYEYTVRVTDFNGLFFDLEDQIIVSVEWWLMLTDGSANSSVYISSDPTEFTTPATLAPVVVAPDYGHKYLGDSTVVIFSSSENEAICTDLDPSSGLTTSAKVVAANVVNVRLFENFSAAFTDDGTSYYVTSDNGVNWSEVVVGGGLKIKDIGRVNGLWVAYRELADVYEMVYSDEPIPETWALASGGHVPSYSPFPIASDGEMALFICTLDRLLKTTDGVNWTLLNPSVEDFLPQPRCALAAEGVFLFGGQNSSGPQLAKTGDGGVTMQTITLPGLQTIERMEYRDGLLVVSGTAAVEDAESVVYVGQYPFNQEDFQAASLPFAIESSTSAVVSWVSRI